MFPSVFHRHNKWQKWKGYTGKCNQCILVRLGNFVVTQTFVEHNTDEFDAVKGTMVFKERLVTLWKLVNPFSVIISVWNVGRSKSGVIESVIFKVV